MSILPHIKKIIEFIVLPKRPKLFSQNKSLINMAIGVRDEGKTLILTVLRGSGQD